MMPWIVENAPHVLLFGGTFVGGLVTWVRMGRISG